MAHNVHIGEVHHMFQTTVKIITQLIAQEAKASTYGNWFSLASQSSYPR
jgi:hypothetical protein